MNESSNSIRIKLFIGIHANGEVKMLLNQSPSWKEDKILSSQKVCETQFQSREYIGKFIESPLPYDQLKAKVQEVKKELQHYCPKLNVDKHSLHLFPQLFIA